MESATGAAGEHTPARTGPALPVSLLITRHFVFLHLPRAAGQFVRKVCFDHLPTRWFVPNDLDWNASYDEIAQDFSDLPIFALVRNPWDWYVSWYHHLTQDRPERRSGPMWERAFERGRADFATVVRRACTGEGFANPRTGAIMRERAVDHYSAAYARIVGSGVDEGRVEVGRFESFRTELLAFLERHRVPTAAGFRSAVLNDPPVNTSRHRSYREYYDDELRELVEARASELIARYGYAF